MQAVRRSGPPKQILVTQRSGIGTWRTERPSGEMIEMPPLTRVATQILPAASTASESKRWKPRLPVTSRPPCGEGQGWRRTSPGASRSNAHSRAVSVSAIYSVVSSGERPMPFGVNMGKAISRIMLPSARA